MFGYALEKSTGHVLNYWNTSNKPIDTDTIQFVECLESEKPELYKESVVIFDPNDFDEWLMANYMGTEVEQYFPILSRATEKNNSRGYQQMLSFAQAKNISQEVQTALINKLTELGANLQ